MKNQMQVQVNLGGIVHLSTVDWPGRASMVIFLRGCPLRCPHCQNRELQMGESFVEFSQIAGEIKGMRGAEHATDQLTLDEAFSMTKARPFVGALVLSGGEPLMQPQPVPAMARLAKGLGLEVGLETCGYYCDQLQEILEKNLVDRIFLDIKAPLREPGYEAATGRKGAASRVLESLKICMRSSVPFEARTTIFPQMPSSDILEIAKTLSDLKVEFPKNRLESLMLQQGRPREREFEPVSWEELKSMAESIENLIKVEVRAAPMMKIDKVDNSEILMPGDVREED